MYKLSLLLLLSLATAWSAAYTQKTDVASHNDRSSNVYLSTHELPGFRQVYVHTESDVQYYTVFAENLMSEITLEADYPLKVSLDCYHDFQSTLTLTPEGGSIEQRIYVRAFPESIDEFQVAISHQFGADNTIELTTHLESTSSQIPDGYYSTATGSGSELKTQLHHIVKDHNSQSYNSLWTHFETTDATFSGKVWDIYSDIPCQEPPYIFTFGDDQDSGFGGNQEGDVYNREHSMPRSWFGGAVNPMNTDLYHIYPVDKHVNAVRDNYPFGMVDNPTWTSLNGGKLGPNTTGNTYSGTAFEPIDAYKGDLARAFLYMITRYEDRIEDWTYSDEGNQMFDHNTYPGYQEWVIDMFLKWHQNDPVSQKERLRNDLVYQIQGNRNPFVDKPQWVEKIWGDTTLSTGNQPHNHPIKVFPNPADDYVQYSSQYPPHTIELFSWDGRKREIFWDNTTISVKHLPSGVYFLRFKGPGYSVSEKLIIQ